MHATILTGLLLLGVADPVAETPPPPPGGDLGRLQGVWTTEAGPDREISVVLEIRGDHARVRLRVGKSGPTLRAEGTLKVDEAASPRSLDWTEFKMADGLELPEVLAIYELDGDTLRVCNGGPNASRPSEFQPGEGALADLHVFRRQPVEASTAAR